uniref:HD/PDEase domain-containing protein n=1 Tax=Desulfobacca acetoxidans TaxID=60893 RepID=A0A7C5EPQ3_9BACT
MENFPQYQTPGDYANQPADIFEEVKLIVRLAFPKFDFQEVKRAYLDIERLFQGDYPGYRSCNTGYHDLAHTQACLLEVAKLVHGSYLHGEGLSERGVALGLISAIMHDTGYIQTSDDMSGTGGKYTLIHIDRSIQFMRGYMTAKGYPGEEIKFCENCLKCTGLQVKMAEIPFLSAENELMGKILGTADLLGQMSDPHYLGKLPELFREFKEAGIQDYASEWEFLQKTPQFWEFTQKRFVNELGNVVRFLKAHFKARWGVDRDLDQEAIQRNIDYLQYVLKNYPTNYHSYLQSDNLLPIYTQISTPC